MIQLVVALALAAQTEGPTQRFCIIGDYGDDGLFEADVAAQVHAFAPDFVTTVGDNNYHDGAAETIDDNVGKHYADFIFPYQGAYGPGAQVNRFFPSLGNHDFFTAGAVPYLDYFELPGNERYYDVQQGDVHLFILNTCDEDEPDGVDADSLQAQWLEQALAGSTATYKLVVMHNAPYSSALHGSDPVFQWPFHAWGADAVLAGHDHVYERLDVDRIPFFVNGLGGRMSIYSFGPREVAGSRYRYIGNWGAMFAEASSTSIRFRFISRSGVVIDDYTMLATDRDRPLDVLVPGNAVWRYDDGGSPPSANWTQMGFDDSSWSAGPAPLGYGMAETTTVGYGGDPQAKHITTWFRRVFEVRSPDDVDALRMDLRVDDGAVVYLNGIEVHRENLPLGALDATTLAIDAVHGKFERAHYEVVVDPGVLRLPTAPALLRPGRNVVAVEVHQQDATSSDLVFDLKLIARRKSEVLLAAGSDWHYLDNGTDPGPTWTSAGFDDGLWDVGGAPLGYGEDDEETEIEYGPDPFDKYATTFFRGSFEVDEANDYRGLDLRIVRDDGAIVYVNEHEVYRFDLPVDGVDYQTYASQPLEGPEETEFLWTRVDPAVLVDGTNTVAVEIHQFNPANADLRFDLEVIGER